MRSLLPYGVSILIGYLFFPLMQKKKTDTDPYLRFFLGAGLGLGISAYLVFLGLLFFNQYQRTFLIGAHALLLGAGIFLQLSQPKQKNFPRREFDRSTLLYLSLITVALLPIWQQAVFYPMGGWDAWSAWNFKAKFIYEAGDNWKNVFSPLLWRSSPHYPLLLPLIIIWGWSPYHSSEPAGSLIVSLLFSYLTAGLMFSALRQKATEKTAAIAVLSVFTLPFFTKLASSQYSDIVVAFYLLSTLVCLLKLKTERNPAFGFLAGIFLGFLSFSKSEGTVAGVLLFGIACLYLFEKKSAEWKNALVPFLVGTAIGVIPLLIFTKFLAPANQTFYNGLTSAEHPSNFFRLKMILAFLLKELISAKWNGIWLLFLLPLILSGKQGWEQKIRVIPIFLVFYLGAVGFYYYLNTYFEIGWWLQVSLNRILFALLPTIGFWVFHSWQEKISNGNKTKSP